MAMDRKTRQTLEDVRLFMERIYGEAGALADRLDPARLRTSKNYQKDESIQALDVIAQRAGWMLRAVFKAEAK